MTDEVVWTGNLRDDCSAVWHGLMLRAEQMSKSRWWWAVYSDEGRRGCVQWAASYDKAPYHAKNGREARAAAEAAAMVILGRRAAQQS
jgi:hypothetical protein